MSEKINPPEAIALVEKWLDRMRRGEQPPLLLLVGCGSDGEPLYDLFLDERSIKKSEGAILLNRALDDLLHEVRREEQYAFRRRRVYRPWDHTPAPRRNGK